MDTRKRNGPPPTVWSYGYEIVPPQPEERLAAIQALLDHEQADARRRARTWAGRVVLEEQVTHILVVSDSPEQDGEVNRRLEAQLQELKVGFRVTMPMEIPGIDAPSAPENGRLGVKA